MMYMIIQFLIFYKSSLQHYILYKIWSNDSNNSSCCELRCSEGDQNGEVGHNCPLINLHPLILWLLFPVFSLLLQLFPIQVSKQWEKLLAKEISCSIQISTRLIWSYLITIPPLEAIHPWLDYQPYFRIKYGSNIEKTILDMSNEKY